MSFPRPFRLAWSPGTHITDSDVHDWHIALYVALALLLKAHPPLPPAPQPPVPTAEGAHQPEQGPCFLVNRFAFRWSALGFPMALMGRLFRK